MTIPTITEYAGVIPDRRANQTQEQFVAAAITWLDYQADTMIPSINLTVEGINSTAVQVGEFKDDAAQSALDAENAARASSFYGEWSTLTGALNKPATVLHNDIYWFLNVDLADVTASQPSFTNTDWQPSLEQIVLLTGGDYLISESTGVPDGYQINFIRQKGVTDAVVRTISGTFKTDKGDFDEIIVGEMYGFTATCINQVWEV